MNKASVFRLWLAAACLFAACLFVAALSSQAEARNSAVAINGQQLSQQELAALQSMVGPVGPGHYWYDPVSGLYGYAGGPTVGQTLAGLRVGGRLRADASGGGTGVYINGREIHPQEYRFLARLYGQVNPGRYWLNAAGIGGYEGGPARFNLRQAIAQAQAGSGGGSVYMPNSGGRSGGTYVGRAGDGCLYYGSGSYSGSSC